MSDSPNLDELIIAALRRITRAIDLHSRVLLHDHGLTAPQLAVLRVIARFQPVTASGVAREVHLSQPTVTGILNRLESRRLLQRSRGATDRRRVELTLTPDAQALLADAPSPLQDDFALQLARLQQWEQTQILATLQRIAAMMEADSPGLPSAPGDTLSACAKLPTCAKENPSPRGAALASVAGEGADNAPE